MTVVDASAILAFLQGEEGADTVEAALAGSAISAVNWSEVAQKVRARGGDWGTARALLLSYDLKVEPVTLVDAEHAAGLWAPGRGLSLADRLCIALSHRLGVDALTADRAWGDGRGIRQIR
ncbi:type II toxin-antitoxin system VapC family toxin [Microbacterium sediminis]|uniref:Twitching motility protein PilT n=1 Tax=Microbacterium sediminis TaxID=904291 RepID=A0A1B9NIG8_9MICO|nr:type II toxin-antitoxin system VapC family toxin [Microbacterium sediminis]OCG76360.1 twitching motility protein PilT [Microbacterium sediminis]QBR73094.1 type II toxin-antitoxin system VapC family toxin [Microbacterium sediminis]